VSEKLLDYRIEVFPEARGGFGAIATGRTTGTARAATRAEAMDKAIDDAERLLELERERTAFNAGLQAFVNTLRDLGWEDLNVEMRAPFQSPVYFTSRDESDVITHFDGEVTFRMTARRIGWGK
jgi:hypothetical protein